MQHWVILSGKGGTGKTTVTAALADLAAREARVVLADADVDASNLELLLGPTRLETHDFVGGRQARVSADRCSGCGECAAACRFGAIHEKDGTCVVDRLACEGCAACTYGCPSGAITMVDTISGTWFRSRTDAGLLFHARLRPGEANSGKMVTQVKQAALLAAAENQADLLLVDGPPGIGCPALAAIGGAHLALIVTEPTVSGVHDLRRVLQVARQFRVPAAVCLNKADLNPEQAGEVAATCAGEGLPLVGAIPFDEATVRAAVRRRPVTALGPGAAAEAIGRLWQCLRSRLAPVLPGGGE
ncbi:MAG: ATP-binding protein [Anaerolineae bacterium]